MYIVQKSGFCLHESIGLYDRLDVAKLFAYAALKNERDSYHQFKIYSVLPECAVEYHYPVVIMHNVDDKIVVDEYNEGVLQSSGFYVKEDV